MLATPSDGAPDGEAAPVGSLFQAPLETSEVSSGDGLFGQPYPASGSMFAEVASGGGLFGQSQPASGTGLFDAAPAGGAGIFGAPAEGGTGLFGASPMSGTSLFQTGSSGSLFGAAGSTPTGGGLFGGGGGGGGVTSGSSGTSLFGNNPKNGLFDTEAADAPSHKMPNTGSGLFGGSGSGLFGGGSSGLFAGPVFSSGAGLFSGGAANSGGGLFSTSTGGGFGAGQPSFGQGPSSAFGGGLFGQALPSRNPQLVKLRLHYNDRSRTLVLPANMSLASVLAEFKPRGLEEEDLIITTADHVELGGQVLVGHIDAGPVAPPLELHIRNLGEW